MFGAITKTYYAEKMGIDPKNIVCVSIMPCTAKKFELTRDDQDAAGVPDVDFSLTTRELARMIRRVGLNFNRLPEEEFDSPLGSGTGAAVIFGATGGVMEAALRTAVWKLTGEKDGTPIEFTEVRGVDGIKEATYNVAGMDVKVAVASGLKNAKELLTRVQNGEADYHFIEIMGCPGGCIAGGGQPIVRSCFLPHEDDDIQDTFRIKRAKALYSEDERLTLRQSHKNPQIRKLYEDYLGKPNSHKAHELLHTYYQERIGYND
jgi:NADP-reducing hydrogenase subunit HndD